MCITTQIALNCLTPNHSSTFSFVLLFFSSPAIAPWPISSVVLPFRKIQPSSLTTSTSTCPHFMYCKVIYYAPPLSIWKLIPNSSNIIPTQSKDPSSLSTAININLFRILLLNSTLWKASRNWTYIHETGISRIKPFSCMSSFRHGEYPIKTNLLHDTNWWTLRINWTHLWSCSLIFTSSASTSVPRFWNKFNIVVTFLFLFLTIPALATHLKISSEYTVQIDYNNTPGYFIQLEDLRCTTLDGLSLASVDMACGGSRRSRSVNITVSCIPAAPLLDDPWYGFFIQAISCS